MLKRRPLLLFFPLAFLLSWYPWLLVIIRDSGNAGPNPLGVLLAAIVVTARVYGRSGLKDLFSRLVRWRAGFPWYALVVLFPLVTAGLGALVIVLFGAVPDWAKLPAWNDVALRFVLIFLFIGSVLVCLCGTLVDCGDVADPLREIGAKHTGNALRKRAGNPTLSTGVSNQLKSHVSSSSVC